MYLNDMAVDIKQLQCGVNLNGFELSILLYADDIVIIAPDEHKLQLMLEFVSSWCKKMAHGGEHRQESGIRNHLFEEIYSTCNWQ